MGETAEVQLQHSSSSSDLQHLCLRANIPNPHQGRCLQKIRSLSSSRGGTCSPPSTPWLLSFSTHWSGKHTQHCHQSLVINRVKGHCSAKLHTLNSKLWAQLLLYQKKKRKWRWKVEKSTREMRKTRKVQIAEPKQWRYAACVEPLELGRKMLLTSRGKVTLCG